jgi:hypothetical protein
MGGHERSCEAPANEVHDGVAMMDLAAFRNAHAGGRAVVCGCGSSLRALERPERFVTIGVNDVGRMFQPNYLVVVDGREHLKERFSYVENSTADFIFTQRTNLALPQPNVVMFHLGEDPDADAASPDILSFSAPSLMTPYIALCLALHMGAREIGLIGVDLTDDHFFATTGRHQWASHLDEIDRTFDRLGAKALQRSCRIFNLSEKSQLTAFPKIPIETFAALPGTAIPRREAERPLRIVSYATTPLVGVPAILARCINARTPHRARCLWAADCYNTGISFTPDINFVATPGRALVELEAADVIVLHNGKVDERHRALVDAKPVLTVAHNYMDNVDDRYVRRGFPGLVVGQYQATLPEFSAWSVVPNPVPYWEKAYSPGQKNDGVTIVYTPSDRHQVYPLEHPLYWHSKGFDATIRILDRLASEYPVHLELPRERFLPHAEVLQIKRRAHIVIDECVTGSYHRNSLEGLAAGCVVVNGVGILAGVARTLRHCVGDAGTLPFVRADLSDLERVLRALIERGPECLAMMGAANRKWFEQRWEFGSQWRRFWWPAITRTLGTRAGTPVHGTEQSPAPV